MLTFVAIGLMAGQPVWDLARTPPMIKKGNIEKTSAGILLDEKSCFAVPADEARQDYLVEV